MNAQGIWSRLLIVVSLAGMLVCAIDPFEGSFTILPCVGLATLGAVIGNSRQRMLLCFSFVLVALGVAAMVVLSWLGGIGENPGNSIWWGIFILPSPVGWFMGLIGAALALIELWKLRSPPPCRLQ